MLALPEAVENRSRELPSGWELKVIRTLLSYLYDFRLNDLPSRFRVYVSRSRRTGRLKEIFLDDLLFATIRLSDGFIVPTIHGWELLLNLGEKYFVEIPGDVAEFVAQGKTVFSKHVLRAYEEILPGDEVAIVVQAGSGSRVVGAGKAVLPAASMRRMKKGKAVKTRHGASARASS